MHLLSFLRDEVRLTALSSSAAVDPVSFHLITDQPLHFDAENARETHKVTLGFVKHGCIDMTHNCLVFQLVSLLFIM